MKRLILFTIVFQITCSICISQEADSTKNKAFRNVKLNGYVKNMQTAWFQNINDKWITDNLIHNRLNFKWYASNSITTVLEARNRLMWGEIVEMIPDYDEILSKDKGFLDLSESIASDTSYILHTMVDRAYVDYVKGKFQTRIGRQRIKWGTNLVWNPNDIFNTFSYFDFDYEERPGTDAVRLQYYPSYTSTAELVYKVSDDPDEMALAGMYRFNKWSYDFQFIGGIVNTDMVAGIGWAGQIEGGGFRGEGTYFHPKETAQDTSGIFIASISGDYTLKNSLYIHGGILYNSEGTTGKAGGRNMLLTNDLSAKSLTLARYSIFGQLSYPINPLVNGGVSGMYNPNDKSAFISPLLGVSLWDNIEWMLVGQIFIGKPKTEFGDYGQLYFSRFRYSF